MNDEAGEDPRAGDHPYAAWRGTRIWSILEAAIEELVDNRDLEEMTPREYIVGFLAKRVTEGGIDASRTDLGENEPREAPT